jgi:SsrA-binding protein
MKIITTNKKANFEYTIIEKFVAGLALPDGYIVKKIRNRELTPDNSFVIFQNNRLEAIGMGNNVFKTSIPLLLKKSEVKKILVHKRDKGITVILLNFHSHGRYLKSEIAIVKGKNQSDKRKTIQARDVERARQRGME